jgi:hypothetical protein
MPEKPVVGRSRGSRDDPLGRRRNSTACTQIRTLGHFGHVGAQVCLSALPHRGQRVCPGYAGPTARIAAEILLTGTCSETADEQNCNRLTILSSILSADQASE